MFLNWNLILHPPRLAKLFVGHDEKMIIQGPLIKIINFKTVTAKHYTSDGPSKCLAVYYSTRSTSMKQTLMPTTYSEESHQDLSYSS